MKDFRLLTIAITIILLQHILSATIINIPSDYPTIQAGIDASSDGDTVLVSPGTYVENINFNGHNIVLASPFLTTGDTSYISQTVIDGNASGSVIRIIDCSLVDIVGFTIVNGNSTEGGGIRCLGSNLKIFNNIIIDCVSVTGGGGILSDQSDVVVKNNIIASNRTFD